MVMKATTYFFRVVVVSAGSENIGKERKHMSVISLHSQSTRVCFYVVVRPKVSCTEDGFFMSGDAASLDKITCT